MEITIGQFTLPVLLTVVLGLIYSIIAIPNRFKPIIAVLCGMGLAMLGMVYAETVITAKIVIEYLLAGLMGGAAAVGLYEIQAKALKRKKMPSMIIVALLIPTFLLAGCATFGVKPWGERTAIEKSVFFMDFYKSQYNDTMAMATNPEITEPQKKIVREKKKLLFNMKLLVRSYDDYAKGGLTVPDGLEQKILDLINRLATMGG